MAMTRHLGLVLLLCVSTLALASTTIPLPVQSPVVAFDDVVYFTTLTTLYGVTPDLNITMNITLSPDGFLGGTVAPAFANGKMYVPAQSYFGSTAVTIYVVDLLSKSSFITVSVVKDAHCHSPQAASNFHVDGTNVFFAVGNNCVYQIDAAGVLRYTSFPSVIGEFSTNIHNAPVFNDKTLVAYDATGGYVLSVSKGTLSNAVVSSTVYDAGDLALINGRVYFGTKGTEPDSGHFVCLNATTLAPIYRIRVGPKQPDGNFGTILYAPIATNGNVAVQTDNGLVAGYANGSAPQLVFTAQITAGPSAPTVGADGTMYFGTSEGGLAAVAANGEGRWNNTHQVGGCMQPTLSANYVAALCGVSLSGYMVVVAHRDSGATAASLPQVQDATGIALLDDTLYVGTQEGLVIYPLTA